MSGGKLHQVQSHYRKQLRAGEAASERALNDAYANTLRQIQPHLAQLYRQIKAKQDAGEHIPVSWLYEEKRLENIRRLITQEMRQYGDHARLTIAQIQQEATQLGLQAAGEQLKALTPAELKNWTFGRPSLEAIKQFVGASQPGSPLYNLFQSFGSEAASAVQAALVTGLTLGKSPIEVARDVQAALDIERARALTIARTEMLRSYRSASLETYKANEDVVGGWIWQAALDPSTCAACIAMNGTKHSLDETMDSHPNCRCTQIPETKSWADILGPLGIDTSGIRDTRPDVQSGSDWFDEQDAGTQKAILGPAKYDAFQNGDFQLSDVVGRTNDPDWGSSIYEKSLKQLVGK